MEDLYLKSKDELISEINLLREKINSSGIFFPGLSVINKYEKIVTQNEDKYKQLFLNAPDATFILLKNRVIECNQKATIQFLCKRENIIGQLIENFAPRIQPDGKATKELIHQLSTAALKGDTQLLQLKLQKKGGEVFDGEICFTQIKIGEENLLELRVREITTRTNLANEKNKVRALQNFEQDFLQIGSWEFNTVTLEIVWNNSAYIIHQLSSSENAPNLNQYFDEFVFNDDKDLLFNTIQQCISTGKTFDMDYRIISKKGKLKYLHSICKPITDDIGSVIKVTGTFQDITDRKKLEIELNQKTESYKSFIENLPEGVVIYTPDKILYANKGAFEIASANSVDVETKDYSVFNFVLPKYHPELERKIQLILNGKRLGGIEMKLVRCDKKVVDIEARSALTEYEGQKAIQVIFSEITYRKQVERKLVESERQLSTLISNLPGMAYRCLNDKNWTMEFVSDGCYKLTGYQKSEIINNSKIAYSDLIIESDKAQVWDNVQQAVNKRKPFTLHYQIKTKKGVLKWIYEQGKGVFNDNDELIALEGLFTDISKQKIAEEELLRSHQQYKNLVDFVPEGIVIHKDGKVIFANKKGLNVFGFTNPKEIIGQSVLDYVLPQYHKDVVKRISDAQQGIEQDFFELKIKTQQGNIIDVETRSTPFVFEGENCVMVAVHFVGTDKLLAKEKVRAEAAEDANISLKREIIEKESVQKKLLQAQVYTKNIINSSLDMIIANDSELNITEFNKAAQIIFGYTSKEVIGKHISYLYASPELFETVNTKMNKDGLFVGEILNKRKDGELFQSFLTATGLYNDNSEIIGGMGVSRDLSKAKEERERLRMSEERYKLIYNQVFIGIARLDLSGRYVQVNQRFCDILGYTESELLQMTFRDITPNELLTPIEKVFSDIVGNKSTNISVDRIYKHKSGKTILAKVNVSTILNDNKEPVSILLVCEDITEQKRNQEKFIEQTAKLNSIIESSNYLVMSIDSNYKLRTFNTNCAKWIKSIYDVDASVGLPMNEGPMYSDDATNQFWLENFIKVFNGSSQYFEIETKDKKKKTSIWEFFLSPIFSDEKVINEVAVIGYDITEKRKNEQRVIAQSAKLNAIFENNSHQISTLDKNFKLTSFNELFSKSLQKDYGVTPEIGMDLRDKAKKYFSATYYDNFIKIHLEALAGASQQTENKVIDQKEHLTYYQIYLDPIVLPDGKVNEVSYIAHDTTDKKLAQKKIIESLKEKEVLLREVHHRVKNNLQVISSILNLQRAYIKDKASDNIFRELQNRIRSMSYIHESLYQTDDFANLNLADYLLNLTNNLKHSYHAGDEIINLELKSDNIFLNLDYSIPCGLIVNELVSNAFKYAFPNGKNGSIFVEAKQQNQMVEVSVRDTGVGIPNGIDIKNTESLGLQLVTSLVEQLNGDIKHENLNPGTKMTFKFDIINKN